MIKSCNCTNTYQDSKYGPSQRVMNTYKDKSGNNVARCTVCGSVHIVSLKALDKKK